MLPKGFIFFKNSHITNWSFKDEIQAYCIDDVKILREMCLQYHEENVEKRQISPWLSITAAGYCDKVIKRQLSGDDYLALPPDTSENDLPRRARLKQLAMEEHWAVLTEGEYWFARLSLRGGRTDVRRLTYTLTQEEIDRGVKIAYVDVVSMYPSVQVKHDYPVGVPQIYVYDNAYYPCNYHRNPKSGNVIDLHCDCSFDLKVRTRNKTMFIHQNTPEPSMQEILDDDDFFGIACVTITPPSNLFIPVLLDYDLKAQKCVAHLNKLVGKVFTSIELKVAIKAGYVLNKIHRFDKYHKRKGLWNDFIKKLYIDKMANSAKSIDGVIQLPSRAQQDELVHQYETRFGMGEMVRDSFEFWDANPVKKQVAKIMLNSGWGKHCQRPNMTHAEIIGIDDHEAQAKFIHRYDAGYFDIKSIQHMQTGTVYESTTSSLSNPNLHNSYIPAGLFVPAYGRLMLYDQMSKLGKRVLYHDTDSIVYIYDPLENYNVPTSEVWGDWEEEDDSKIGIVSFTAIAPKSYGYRLSTGKEVTKFKGVSLKASHKDILNLSSMEEMVASYWRGQEYVVKVPQFGIRFSKKTNETFTSNTFKNVQFDASILKGNLHTDGLVYPDGYCRGCLGLSPDHTH